MLRSLLLRFLLRLADLQINRPWLVVALIALSVLPTGLAASKLELRTEFSQLLPDNKPSVIEMRRVEQRIQGMSTLTVVAHASGPEPLKRFVDELGPRIAKLPPDLVGFVDSGTREVRRFVAEHKHLYADLEDIREIHDEIIERYDYEVGQRAGFDLGLDAEEDSGAAGADTAVKPPPIDAEALRRRFSQKIEAAEAQAPGLDGYYIGEGGTLAAVLVRSPIPAASLRAFELQAQIEAIVADMHVERFDAGLEVFYGGNAITSAEEHRDITADLAHVGIWGVSLILGIVLLFFMRMRMLFAMALTIGVGCTWAFGCAWLSVGYLNSASGFLASIIAGNGINFGIIYMARYIEARRDEKLDVAGAVRVAHRETYSATLAAAGAAMVAYGSLIATDFRGFRHFGIIGGAGMLLCWAATYAFLPAFLVLSERHRPLFQHEAGWRRRIKGVYGYPFVWISRSFPRVLLALSLASGLATTAIGLHYFSTDRMEYDLRKIKNDFSGSGSSARRITARVDAFTSSIGQDGKAMLTDRLEQVPPLVAELERRRDAAPPDQKPFERVVSYLDLLPKQQPEKLVLLSEIKLRLQKARERGFINDADWAELARHIPEKLAPLGLEDLPEEAARLFTEKDGRRGNVVYIVPDRASDHEDAHFIMRWADSFRAVTLPSGEVLRGSGAPVIFSDMLLNIAEDAPKAIGMSLVGTLLVVFFAFRERKSALLTLGTLGLGLVWMLGLLALNGVKLNFLNFIALPITIGVGADYALNVVKRCELQGSADLDRVITETGGAVVLCSLTTSLGYLALLLSLNGAVRSFGLAAALGEGTTLLAAMLVLPAGLYWARGRRDSAARRAAALAAR